MGHVDARPYHHGTLRPALLDAAERMLERDGPDQLSLRAIARAAGVSHAAPAHHFGDLRGLLTALAATGFRRFTRSLDDAAITPKEPLKALGRAYVRFARMNPSLFLLMFRSNRLNAEDEDLRAAMAEAFATLAEAAEAGSPPSGETDARARPLASWCLAHGFAMLLLDGRLPSEPGADDLLEAVLAAT